MVVNLATSKREVRDQRNVGYTFTVTNCTAVVAMDANATADAAICDVLGTLIAELINAGIIQGTVNTA